MINGTKICRKCKIEKDSSAFNKCSRNVDKLQSYCVACSTTYSQKWIKTQHPHYSTNVHYTRTYGITYEDAEKLLRQQCGKCALCGVSVSLNTGRGFANKAHIDHCHKTKAVRGILCGNCNTALGKLGDSVESITNVLHYLQGTAKNVSNHLSSS